MEPFETLRAVAAPIDIANCDTDQIIPARFLRYLPADGGYERYLFHDLRFDASGRERPAFVLNRDPFSAARILVADINWGCGSSREQAVYALVAFGIRAVIAPSFGDIHFNNCTRHGVVPVRLPGEVCEGLRTALLAQPGAEMEVDLEACRVRAPDGTIHTFEIGAFERRRLLAGLDDVDVTREFDAAFERFESAHRAVCDWI